MATAEPRTATLAECFALEDEVAAIWKTLGYDDQRARRHRSKTTARWKGIYGAKKKQHRKRTKIRNKRLVYFEKQPLVRVSDEERQALRFLPYEQYLQSDYWKQVRKAIYSIRPSRCESCGKGRSILDIHHLTYERVGCEWPIDLMIVCRGCHGDRHNTVLPSGSRSAGRVRQNATSRSHSALSVAKGNDRGD